MPTIKIPFRSWTGKAALEIEVLEGIEARDRLKSALKIAVDRGADLCSADLSGADLRSARLRGARLHGADLCGARLHGADLCDADLNGADLRVFRSDIWEVLTTARNEISGLVSALRDGRINGSVYAGKCACLVGTIANIRGVSVYDLQRDSGRPAEQWFLMIKKGDKPGDDSAGGFAAAKALEWVHEYCALTGIELPMAAEEDASCR